MTRQLSEPASRADQQNENLSQAPSGPTHTFETSVFEMKTKKIQTHENSTACKLYLTYVPRVCVNCHVTKCMRQCIVLKYIRKSVTPQDLDRTIATSLNIEPKIMN